MAQQHSLFGPQAEARERIRAAVHTFREIAVRVRAGVVDECSLGGTPRGEVAFDEVMRGVVVARNVNPRRTHPMISRAERRHLIPPIGDLPPRHPRAHAGDEADRSADSDNYGRRDRSTPALANVHAI
jgi:hypothetical protein